MQVTAKTRVRKRGRGRTPGRPVVPAGPEARPSGAAPLRLGFILLPQFSMMSFSAALEPLRSANRLSGRRLYDWHLASLDGAPVEASNGIPIGVHGDLGSLERPDLVVVCAALEPLRHVRHRGLAERLRYLACHGARVGAISAGPFVLAAAGLLGRRRCTVHWEYRDLFAEHYPQARLTDELFVVDGGVFTCSGGTAALDLMLGFIREQHGAALAIAVAEQFLHTRIRGAQDQQRMEISARYRVHDATLIEVLRLMEETIEEPLQVEALGARSGISARQVERLFRRHIGEAPASFYLRLRVERGQTLLQQTCQSVHEIALACGFRSTSHFAHAYRRQFDRTPSDERRLGDDGPGARRAAAQHQPPAPSLLDG
jgi:transcriptional regulator GlxA family with amidase domain